jgi:DNA-directed RNA polymerase subunit RPC12/RpoP
MSISYSEPKEKGERKKFFRQLFYEQWGDYSNYLKQKEKKKKKPDFELKLGEVRCPKCGKNCEVVLRKNREEEWWFPVGGYKCEYCGFRQKMKLEALDKRKKLVLL